ncbi:MAG: CBS domain-containing protein [bacterium]
MSHLKSLIKVTDVVSLTPQASVFEACQKMSERMIGSVIVSAEGQPTGIFTERDLLNRVVAKGLDPKTTPLEQVMSKGLKTVSVHETVEACFKKMEETKCRHIPIEDGGKLVGVVTMRNILEWLTDQMKEENLFLKNYIQS